MKPPAATKRFSPWLRFLVWTGFGLLCLATLLVVTRWMMLNHGHQETLRITQSLRKKPSAPVKAERQTTTDKPGTAQGMTLAEVPHFGQLLTGDEAEWRNFQKSLTEIDDILWMKYRPDTSPWVDGHWDFRVIVQNMGGEAPGEMTEAEAAAEFLKLTDRFSGLLDQWREAVAAGPMAREGEPASNSGVHRFTSLSGTFSNLLNMTTSARLQAGDGDAAWTDWQTMKNSDDRLADLYPAGSGHDQGIAQQTLDLAKSGVRSGAWSDAHLAGLSDAVARIDALATARKAMEFDKQLRTRDYNSFREHQAEFRDELTKTPSPFHQLVNLAKSQLITDQQIQDNLALSLHNIDQRLNHFDPETGYYVQPTEAEKQAVAENIPKSNIFGSYYFMIEDVKSRAIHQEDPVTGVIRKQTGYDQLRLAAALETHYRSTGSYPEHLASVSGQFPDGAPQDIATGQPYFYQREADGGYKLWSTGIDGKSDGGDDRNDVTWKQPARTK